MIFLLEYDGIQKMEKLMKTRYNIQDFLEMYYLDSNIPAYLYQKETPVFCVPEQTGLTYPPGKYLEILMEKNTRIFYCSTEYGIYYGALRLGDGTDYRLIFG